MNTIYLSCGICLASVLLCVAHVRSFRMADHGGLGDEELTFLRRQFIRRLQTSGILGVIGLLLLGEMLPMAPFVMAAYWMLVLVLVVWMVMLAFSDWIESRWFWGRSSKLSAEQEAFLAEEIARFRQERERDAEEPPQ
ncbi:MAG: hypothetical protein ACO1RA_16925 [Planctomycetaceae bacterium]